MLNMDHILLRLFLLFGVTNTDTEKSMHIGEALQLESVVQYGSIVVQRHLLTEGFHA